MSPDALSYDAATNTATFTFAANVPLPDGNYRATLSSASVSNGVGIPLDGSGTGAGGDYTFNFFSLAGDANHDGKVDFADLLALAQHFGQTTAAFADGDLNYDGSVNFDDLLIVAQAYGHHVTGTAAVAAKTRRETRPRR